MFLTKLIIFLYFRIFFIYFNFVINKMSCSYCLINKVTHHCGGPCGNQTLYCSQMCGELHYAESHAKNCQLIAGGGNKRSLADIIEEVEVERYLKQLIIEAQQQAKTRLRFDTRLALENVSAAYEQITIEEIRMQMDAYFQKMPKEIKFEWSKNMQAPFVNMQKEIMDTYLRISVRNISERRSEKDELTPSIYSQIATFLEIMGYDIPKASIATFFQDLATSTDPMYAFAQKYFKKVRARIEEEKLKIFRERPLLDSTDETAAAAAVDKFTTGEMFDMVMEHFITRWKAGQFSTDEIDFNKVARQFTQSLNKRVDMNLLMKSWQKGPDSFEPSIRRFIKEKKPQYEAAYNLMKN